MDEKTSSDSASAKNVRCRVDAVRMNIRESLIRKMKEIIAAGQRDEWSVARQLKADAAANNRNFVTEDYPG